MRIEHNIVSSSGTDETIIIATDPTGLSLQVNDNEDYIVVDVWNGTLRVLHFENENSEPTELLTKQLPSH